jgi:pyruvate dehydrogenase E1 component
VLRAAPTVVARDSTVAIRDLGGHDLAALGEAFCSIDDTQPTVIGAGTLEWATEATERAWKQQETLLEA